MALRTLTVQQLIDRLSDEDPDALVVVTADYGDYHHTAQALPLRGDVDDALLVESAYSASGYALRDNDDVEDDDEGAVDEEAVKYVVLR